jgi:outer membrane protein assembly factor BamB
VTVRRLGVLLAAVVLLAAAGLVVWRVLAPAEVSAQATDPYPAPAVHPPGVTGKTVAAPLIVAGRIRVYAAKRQVRADAPVDAKTSYTPRWSYRRWPAQLNGVVAVGSALVTRWSDGKLVAIDGRTGRIAWRADGPPAGGYVGERTGAATVWAPPGLYTAGDTVLAAGGGRVHAYDAATGALRWRAESAADCGAVGFTTAGGRFVCGRAVYDAATGAHLPGWPPGPFAPLACDVARSGCGGLRAAAGRAWLASSAYPVRAPNLDGSGRFLAGGLVLSISGGAVLALGPLSGAEAWRWSAPPGQTVALLGAATTAVHLLTSTRQLVTLDARTGAVRSAFPLAVGTEKTTWTPGLWQTADGYVAVERLDDPDPASVHHYFTVETVIIAAAP